MKAYVLIFALSLLLSSCGYRYEDEGEQTTITVPFIKGDEDGLFTAELVRALSTTGHFEYRKSNANLELLVTIVSNTDDRIGYRYDRDPTTGKRRKNIVGTENREAITVEVNLIDSYTQEVILGPETITATADYDYVDSNSIRDLTFFNDGTPTTVIDFSLGQLDSIEGAHDDAQIPIFRKLAQKITDGLLIREH